MVRNKTLRDYLIPTFNLNVPRLSTETIAPQVGDAILSTLYAEFDNMLTITSYVTEYSPKGSGGKKELLANKGFLKARKIIEDAVYDRFGLPIRIGLLSGYGSVANSAMYKPRGYDKIEDILNDTLIWANQKSYMKIVERDGWEATEQEVMWNGKQLAKLFATDGIVVNNEKAKITGIPKDGMRSIISINFETCVWTLGLDYKELTAIFLHELGHMYTYLETMYRTTNNTTILLDTLQDNIRNNESPKEAFRLAYERATGTKLAKADTKDTIFISLGMVKFANQQIQNVSPPTNAAIDNEHLADTFASRFGLGGYIASALDKIETKMGENGYKANYSLVDSVKNFLPWQETGMLATMGLCLFYISQIGVSSVVVLVMGVLYFGFKIYDSIANAFKNANDLNKYDDIKRRYERLRLDIIRILRQSDLTKEEMASTLNQLDLIDKLIAEVGKSKKFIDKFLTWLVSNKNELNLKLLEQELENMMENDLHVSVAKLKSKYL